MKFKHSLSQRCEFCNGTVGKTSNAQRKIPIMLCVACLNSTPSEEYRCSAEVGKGTETSPRRQCKRWAIWGQGLCGSHNKVKKGSS